MPTPIAPDLWEDHHDLFMPGGVHFPCRMTTVRLADGTLLLHSPVPIDDALAAELEALGTVAHLVAPNNLHHLFFSSAAERWPTASCWVAPGLPAKLATLPPHSVLGRETPPWADTLEPHFIDGIPWMEEHAFFHRPSGSLLVTDLFFHMKSPANWLSSTLFWLMGIKGRPAQSPLVARSAKDKPAAGRSARALLQLPCERLVPCHGPVIEDDAPAVLSQVLAKQASW